MWLNSQHVFTFLTIVDNGSIGRAAECLHITQSAVSRTIKRLEDEVGAELFERHSKGMRLTEVGETLLPHARHLMHETEKAREDIDNLRGLSKGTVRVGAVSSIASGILPVAVARMLDAHPSMRVKIVEGVWDRLAEALLTREIDLALSIETPDTDEIVAIPTCRWTDMSVVVAATDHPLRQRKNLTLRDTLDYRWALPPRGTAPYQDAERVFAMQGLALPAIAVETRSITALKNLIGQCGFLSWMPQPMYYSEWKANIIDELSLAGMAQPRTLTAFRRRDGKLSRPTARLIEELCRLADEGLTYHLPTLNDARAKPQTK